MTSLRVAAMFMAIAACWTQTLGAQGYPAKPIRIIVPTSPGGVNDVVTRLLAPKLGEALGRPVIVENHAPTVLGTALVAKAAPDGYTVLSIFDNFPLVQILFKDVPYDALRDFTPLSLIVTNPMVIGVSAQLGVKDLGRFLQRARSEHFNYATAGAGTSSHLAVELFKSTTGIELQAVHYKGAAPAVSDLLGGRVQLMIAGAVTLMPQVRPGKVVPLAVTSLERLSALPNVPTVAETYPGFEARGWQGMVAPAGTASEIVARLNADIGKSVRSSEVRRNLEDQAYEVVGSSPQLLGTLIASEYKKWGKVIRDRRITLD